MAGEPSSYLDIDVEGGESVWSFINERRLATENCINHGQGFPNWECEPFVKQAAQKAIQDGHNQYAHNQGIVELRETLLNTYKEKFGSQNLDGNILSQLSINNIQITNGCAGALDASFLSFLNEGDEVVTIEPYFDFYKYQVGHKKAVLKTVPLDLIKKKIKKNNNKDTETQNNKNNKNNNNNNNNNEEYEYEYEWSFDANKLLDVFNHDKTRMLILNTPHNPTGYVMEYNTMVKIAKILLKFPKILVLTDEVYEYILYDNCKHYHFSCITVKDDNNNNKIYSMWDRTITLSSAAKTFSVTGWKIGWAIGPSNLIKYINYSARGVTWCVSTPMQYAINDILKYAKSNKYKGFENYYEWLSNMYENKRNLIINNIRKLGMIPIIPKGAFYIIADVSTLMKKINLENGNNNIDFSDPKTFQDWKFTEWLINHLKIATIPVSAFIDYKHLKEHYNANANRKTIANNNNNNGESDVTYVNVLDKGFDFIRFCFCVTDETIEQTGTKAKLVSKL